MVLLVTIISTGLSRHFLLPIARSKLLHRRRSSSFQRLRLHDGIGIISITLLMLQRLWLCLLLKDTYAYLIAIVIGYICIIVL